MPETILAAQRLRNSAKGIIRFGINTLPGPVAGKFVRRFPRFVPYLDERDITVTIENPYFGHARFRLSRKYRLESELLYRGAFDEKSLLYFMRLLRAGDVCLDVGANVGALSLSMSHRVGQNGRVIAFEPGPLLFERLERNLDLSGAHNVEAHQIGLSNKRGKLFWSLEEGDNAGNAMLSSSGGDTVVEVQRLDDCDFISGLQRIDFVKIDVEGMELEVIEGGISAIKRHHPMMLVETLFSGDAAQDEKIKTMFDLLGAVGYESWEIDTSERDLRSYQPDFGFVPCAYPTLPQNTLFVHKTRQAELFDSVQENK